MPGTAEAVMSLVSKEFGGARVRAAYEAGCSGFWLYRKLVKAGIDCIVVHAASIEVSSRDTVKTDKRDSLKIAQQLSAGRLRGVRVPTEEEGFKACHRSCGRSVSKDVYTDSCGEEGIGEELSWSG
jgi:transposase